MRMSLFVVLSGAILGLLIWFISPDRTTTQSKDNSLSAADKSEIMQIIGDMTPGDLSVLQALLQQKEDAQIMTVAGSANDKFYSKMKEVGFAQEVPSGLSQELQTVLKGPKSFTLTQAGKEYLKKEVPVLSENVKTAPLTHELVRQIGTKIIEDKQ